MTRPIAPKVPNARTNDHAAMVDAAWVASEAPQSASLQALGDHPKATPGALQTVGPPYLPLILTPAVPTMHSVLADLGDAMQAVGIAKHDAADLVQTFATTIAQAQAKAAMRQENTK